jgi:uncharacterized protein (DUF849 family)
VFSREATDRFLREEEVLVSRKRPKEERTVDLRRQVTRLEVVNSGEVQLEMRLAEKDNLKPADALAAIFGLDEGQARDLEILKIKSS